MQCYNVCIFLRYRRYNKMFAGCCKYTKTFLARSHLAPPVSSLVISAIKMHIHFPNQRTSSRLAQWYTFIKRSREQSDFLCVSWEQARAAFVTTSLFQSWTKENRKWFGGRRESKELPTLCSSRSSRSINNTPKAKLIHFPLFPCCSSRALFPRWPTAGAQSNPI